MKKPPPTSPEARALRQQAEQKLREQPSLTEQRLGDTDARALVHELQVHQIELEMQNEELLRIQAEAQQAADKYTELFDFAPVGYFILYPLGVVREVNLAGAALLGLDRQRVTGQPFEPSVAPDSRAAFAEFIGSLRPGEGRRSCETRLLRHGHGPFDVLVEATVVESGPGERQGYRLAVTEITKRKQAEAEVETLRQHLEQVFQERTAEVGQALKLVEAERKRFRDALDQLPAYLVLLSPDYRVPFANRFFEERFGKSEGRRCYEYLFNRTEPCEVCETFKVLKTQAPLRWEWTGPDGCIYDIYDFPFTDTDGSPLIMEVGLDITERKKAEAELAKYREHLEELVKERSGQLQTANAQLQTGNEELARFNRAMVGRELRMVELKKEVNEICRQAGQPPRYPVVSERGQSSP